MPDERKELDTRLQGWEFELLPLRGTIQFIIYSPEDDPEDAQFVAVGSVTMTQEVADIWKSILEEHGAKQRVN